MDIFHVLTMVGGFALFLCGMNTMGDRLVMLSGGKLEKILEKLTSNRLMALLLGAAVTAIIQSSSATTVMVVGFVNSGIMKLSQAVGVIMGANIGTTITSWILSLTGISSSNFFLKLLKPSSFTPLLAAIGIVLSMTNREGTQKKTLGDIFLGFAILMFGMETMSGAMAPLKDNVTFTGMMVAFSNPLLGILAGALLTAIIQSSSASVGILQALCLSGSVTYGTAIPIILGQNIGTCVTAILSAIGATKTAKRASLVHLTFNLVGTMVFVCFFYFFNWFFHFSFLQTPSGAAGIALIHTLFNIGCSVVLFPFADLLVKFTSLIVKEEEIVEVKDESYSCLTALDERFLESPAFALQLCWNAYEKMSDCSRKAVMLASELVEEFDEEKKQEVIRLEQAVDTFEDTLGTYLVKIAGKDLTKRDSHILTILLHGINDVERISDHALNLVEAAESMNLKGLSFSEEGSQELAVLSVAVHEILNLTFTSFFSKNQDSASGVEPMEEVIDDLVLELKQRHIERLKNGLCSMETGILLEDILTNYERISDHCSNIAVTLIEVQSDLYATHRYLEERTKGSDPQFQKEYLRMKKIYVLPTRP